MIHRLSSSLAILLATVTAGAPTAVAQEDGSSAPPPAAPADVASIDAIVTAVYDVISGPAGQARDWNRFRSLFVPGAKLIPSGRRRDGEGNRHLMWSVDDYVQGAGRNLEVNGFFEQEIHRVTERYGHVAHLFSTYESRRAADDPEPFIRGINSIQLLNDGSRWWVVNIFWTDENSAPIPAKYLP